MVTPLFRADYNKGYRISHLKVAAKFSKAVIVDKVLAMKDNSGKVRRLNGFTVGD